MVRRLLFALCFVLCSAVNVSGMAPEYRAAVHAALMDLYYQHPEYKLGGKIESGQTDCSDLIREGMRRGAVPNTNERTQAWVICMGKGPYTNKVVKNWNKGDNELVDII